MNPSLISYIMDFKPYTTISVFTNVFRLDFTQSVTMYMLPLRVSYKPYSISNILALVDVTSQVIVTMDTNNEPAMFVHTIPYSVLKSYQFHEGLYYFDTSATNVLNPSINAYSFLSNAQENNNYFCRTKIEGRDAAIILQHPIGFHSIMKFKITMKGKQLQNSPITFSGIDRYHDIYRPRVSTIKVNSAQKCPGHIDNIPRVSLQVPIEK